MQRLRFIFLTLLGLASLVICANLLGGLFTFPGNGVKRTKFTHLQEHRDDYDAVFIGSSRYHRQIIPAIFDAGLREAGLPLVSYNAAEGGMFPPESYFFTREVLKLKSKKLRFVFLEPGAMVLQAGADNADSLRFVNWHDWTTSREVVEAVQASAMPSEQKKENLLAHGRAWFQRSLSLGFATAMFSDWDKAESATAQNLNGLIAANRGWVALDDEMQLKARAKARGNAFQKRLPEYRKLLAALKLEPVKRPKASNVDVRTLKRLVKRLERANIQIVHLIPPAITRQDRELNLVEKVGRGPIIDFANADRYPELYEENVRFDFEHLNREGAERFTRLLAAQFAEYLQTRVNAK